MNRHSQRLVRAGGAKKKKKKIKVPRQKSKPIPKEREQKKSVDVQQCPVLPGRKETLAFANEKWSANELTDIEKLWNVMTVEKVSAKETEQTQLRSSVTTGLKKLGPEMSSTLVTIMSVTERTLQNVNTMKNNHTNEDFLGSPEWIKRLTNTFAAYDTYWKQLSRLFTILAHTSGMKPKQLKTQVRDLLIEIYGKDVVILVSQLQKRYRKASDSEAYELSLLPATHIHKRKKVMNKYTLSKSKILQQLETIDVSNVVIVQVMNGFWNEFNQEANEEIKSEITGGDESEESTTTSFSSSKGLFVLNTTKTLASHVLWLSSTLIVNIVWIGSLANLNTQALQFTLGALDPLLTNYPLFKAPIDFFVGSVVKVDSILPSVLPDSAQAAATVASAASPYLGSTLGSFLGTISSTAIQGFAYAGEKIGAISSKVIGSADVFEFKPGYLLTLANRVNTTAGVYFGKFAGSIFEIVKWVGSTVYTCLSWLLATVGLKWVLLLALIFLSVTIVLNVVTVTKYLLVPLKAVKNLWNRIRAQLAEGGKQEELRGGYMKRSLRLIGVFC